MPEDARHRGAAKSNWPHEKTLPKFTEDKRSYGAASLRQVVTRAIRPPTTPRAHRPRMRGGIKSRSLRRRCQSPKLRAQQASCMLRSVGASHCRVQWGSSHTRASRHLLRVCTAASSEALPAGNRSPLGYPHNHHHLAKCDTSHRDRHRIATMVSTAARGNTSNQRSSLSSNRIFQSTILNRQP